MHACVHEWSFQSCLTLTQKLINMPKVIQLVFVRARTVTQGGVTPERVLGFLHHTASWGVRSEEKATAFYFPVPYT